jgi:transposase
MDSGLGALPDDIAALKAALIAEAARAASAEAQLAVAKAKASDDQALIAHQQLRIEKLTRELYGPRSERTSRLLDQAELQLEELESSATEDEIAAEMAVAKTTTVAAFTRKRPARKPFPEHLPRERVIVPGPTLCLCCGGGRLRKLGEDVTETLEVIPRQWKVIQHVREKLTCRDCETISQAPAPFHVIARGWAGPSLLAMILFEKFGQHQPLNRQAERYAKEGVPLSLSTLADQVGGCTAALTPLFKRIEAHVLRAERLHGDDTTVPVLAKGKTDTGRIWVYVRDDKPFGGPAPPAAAFYYSRDRAGEHPQAHLATYSGIFQADAYSGYGKLYEPGRFVGPHLRSGLLGSRPTPVLRHGRSSRERPSQSSGQEAGSHLAARAGSGPPDRRPVRHRAHDQRPERRTAQGRAPGAQRAARRRSGGLDARAWSNAGPRSPGSSRMGASACQTMPRNERCAEWPSEESRGCSPAPTAADSAPPRCTASLSRHYAELGIGRFMPRAELCRTNSFSPGLALTRM